MLQIVTKDLVRLLSPLHSVTNFCKKNHLYTIFVRAAGPFYNFETCLQQSFFDYCCVYNVVFVVAVPAVVVSVVIDSVGG